MDERGAPATTLPSNMIRELLKDPAAILRQRTKPSKHVFLEAQQKSAMHVVSGIP